MEVTRIRAKCREYILSSSILAELSALDSIPSYIQRGILEALAGLSVT